MSRYTSSGFRAGQTITAGRATGCSRAEIALRTQIEAVAAQRRALPLGGEVSTDYGFEEGKSDTGATRTVRLSEPFEEGKDTLLLYSFMFIPGEPGLPLEVACPSCTSIIDAVDGEAPHIVQRANLAVAAKVPIRQFREHGRSRGWRNIRLLSSADRPITTITTLKHPTEDSNRLRPCSFVVTEGSITSGAASFSLLPPTPAGTCDMSTSCGRCGTSLTARPRAAVATGARDSSTAEMTSRSIVATRPLTLDERELTPVVEQLLVVSALLALAGVAWVATDLRMARMDAGPGTDPGGIGLDQYLARDDGGDDVPRLAPMVLAYRNLQRRRAQEPQAHAGETGLFLGGYLPVWAAAGLLGYAALKAGRSLDGKFFAWDRGERWAAAGVLVVAALYELTSRKGACLTRCRCRGGFLLERWRDARGGALRMGIEHGAWCLGCCWALMAALLALGATSVAWMVLISALIAAERLLPWRALATGEVASVLAAIAIGVAAAPASVPALMIPRSPTAMRAMRMSPSSSMSH